MKSISCSVISVVAQLHALRPHAGQIIHYRHARRAADEIEFDARVLRPDRNHRVGAVHEAEPGLDLEGEAQLGMNEFLAAHDTLLRIVAVDDAVELA